VLDIVGVWRSTILENISYFDEARVLEFGAQKVISIIKDTKARFKKNAKNYLSYGCFEKIGQYIDNKLKAVVSHLSELMDDAIIDFNPSVYGNILTNYTQMVSELDLYNKLQNLPLMLENNLNKIFKRNFTKEITGLDKLEAVSGTEYLQFFERLLPALEAYLHNWHLTTRWHL
jgi:hypothetical protein